MSPSLKGLLQPEDAIFALPLREPDASFPSLFVYYKKLYSQSLEMDPSTKISLAKGDDLIK